MANFWDIFSKISFNRVFADIMRPKGHDQDPSPSELDENDETQRWVYPKFGVEFPLPRQKYFKSIEKTE